MWRKHPVVLPHKLVCEPCWPRIDPADVETYWQNLESHQSPLASISPDHSHIPLWIWGDECQFRENGDELLLICIGCVVDARKFSVEVCYPLALCRSDAFPQINEFFGIVTPCNLRIVFPKCTNQYYFRLWIVPPPRNSKQASPLSKGYCKW